MKGTYHRMNQKYSSKLGLISTPFTSQLDVTNKYPQQNNQHFTIQNNFKSHSLNLQRKSQQVDLSPKKYTVINHKLKKNSIQFIKNTNKNSIQQQITNNQKEKLMKIMNLKLSINHNSRYQQPYYKSIDNQQQNNFQLNNAFPKKQWKSKIFNNKNNITVSENIAKFNQKTKNKSSSDVFLEESFRETLKRIERQQQFSNADQLITIFTFKETIAPLVKKKNYSIDIIKPKTSCKFRKKNIRSTPLPITPQIDSDKVYKNKIQSFLQFIFKVNISNNIFINTSLNQNYSAIKKYKVYVGKGNNKNLIVALLKRRFWIEISEEISQDVQFYWTQNSLSSIHQLQPKKIKLQQPFWKKIKKIATTTKLNYRKIENEKLFISNQMSKFAQNFMFNINLNSKINQIELQTYAHIVTNHIPNNSFIGSKKGLFYTLENYYRKVKNIDPFKTIPKTYHFTSNNQKQFQDFLNLYKYNFDSGKNSIWIVKPGECSNRGNGITIMPIKQISHKIIKNQKHLNGQSKTYIFQQYIKNPLLYHGRKFDIRHYMMVTSVNGILKAYWYSDGYIRTSSQFFNLKKLSDNYIHLTNDAIQKNHQKYGFYQPGNKISYYEFQRYLDNFFTSRKLNFNDVLSRMKQIATDIIYANFKNLDKDRKMNNFQIFGLDFMVDYNFNVWLIQVNSNPCLQTNCSLLSRIIPIMVQHSLRLGLDCFLPPSTHYPPNKRYFLPDNLLKNFKYQIIFDELRDNDKQNQELFLDKIQSCDLNFDQIQDQYENQGKQIDPANMNL